MRSFLRIVLLLLVSSLSAAPSRAQAGRLVRVASYHYPPVVFRAADGTHKGLQVELLEDVARAEGWRLEFVDGSWSESLDRLERGEVDLLTGIAYSEERARRYRFNEETFVRNWGQLYAPEGRGVKGLSELQGARIALYRQGIFSESLANILRETGIQASYVEVEDYDAVFALLDRGEADAGVVSRLYGALHAPAHSAEPTPIIFMPTEVRVAAPRDGDPTLLQAIDARLRDLKAQKGSLYYDALQRWTVDALAQAAARYRFPRWAGYLLALLGGGALMLLATSIVLERRVLARTAELREKNERLGREMAEKERTEAALRENERQLGTLMDNIPGLVYRCWPGPGWPAAFVSRASRELLGWEPQAFTRPEDGTGLWDRIHPDDRAEADAKRRGAVEEGRPYQLLYRMATRSGAFKWVCDYGVGVRDASGEVVALEGLIADVTPQQEAELQLRRENLKLRSVMKERFSFGSIIGRSPAMQEVYEHILKAAASDDPVVVTGESGTGKELVARTVHDMSRRSGGPFVPVNCAAIPENLLESEFFGHRKGAFTGAEADREGLLAAARGGTLFLDEIGDISLGLQVKLLRALEGGGYTPVGSTGTRTADVRVVAATNKDLRELVRQGKMREDFYYRIHIIPIRLPPLRERRADIPLLVDHFLERYPKEARPPVTGKIMEAFHDYHWPGNVRELQNVLKRYVALKQIPFEEGLSDDAPRRLADLVPGGADLQSALQQFEREYLLRTLEENGWHRGRVAELLKINRKTLYKKMQVLGLTAGRPG